MPDQLPLPFDDDTPHQNGADAWRKDREHGIAEIRRRTGMPVGHPVEAVLTQGPVLRGHLRLARNELWLEGSRHDLEFEIDGTTFRLGDIESIARTD